MNIREPQYFAKTPEPRKPKHLLLVSILSLCCWVAALLVLVSVIASSSNERQVLVAAEQMAPRVMPKAPPKPFEFPAGGRTLTPAYRFVALYGSPDMPALGALGEQPIAESIARAQALAAAYQPLTAEHVYPTLEIITTIASAPPTDNGNYSQELDIAKLQPWIDAAKQAGVYVVLDLQPGRSDFLSQAKLYEPLLKLPHVGLALDPEWRLAPDQVHLNQIGSVGIEEVNQVAVWLAELTKAQELPQKLFLLHQFQLAMIQNREALDVTHPELAYMIQMDGSGSQQAKLDTWNTLLQAAPANTAFGWKNFYREDQPTLDPAGTMAITPQPYYVSYQ
jgi:hypothetical protein